MKRIPVYPGQTAIISTGYTDPQSEGDISMNPPPVRGTTPARPDELAAESDDFWGDVFTTLGVEAHPKARGVLEKHYQRDFQQILALIHHLIIDGVRRRFLTKPEGDVIYYSQETLIFEMEKWGTPDLAHIFVEAPPKQPDTLPLSFDGLVAAQLAMKVATKLADTKAKALGLEVAKPGQYIPDPKVPGTISRVVEQGDKITPTQ